MPKLKITKSFPFAHRGCDVVQYEAGLEIETDDQELIATVLAEKWGTKVRGPREPDANKDKGPAPETKGAEGTAAGDAGATDPEQDAGGDGGTDADAPQA